MAKPTPWLVPAVWLGALLPVPTLVIAWSDGALGANPIATSLNRLGLLGLISLISCLACTPVQKFSGWTWPARVKKHLGLIAFTYVSLHLLLYVEADQQGKLSALLEDVLKHPFILLGFAAWVLLLPLAFTSTSDTVKWLGYARWKRLHRLAYVCGALGCVHFILREKTITSQSVSYAVAFAVLMLARVPGAVGRRRVPAKE